jgi:hypothetical protein
MPFFRQRQEGFAEEGHFGNPDSEFACFSPEQMSRDADQIPKIEQLEQFIRLGTYIVQLHINLQPPSRSKNVSEARFSMEAESKNAAGYADSRLGCIEGRCIGIPVLLKKFIRGCCPIEFVGICFMPTLLDLGELFLALKKLVGWIKR